jgi:hypothetical protein
MDSRCCTQHTIFPLTDQERGACEAALHLSQHTKIELLPNVHINERLELSGFHFEAAGCDMANVLPIPTNLFDCIVAYEILSETSSNFNGNVLHTLQNMDEYKKRCVTGIVSVQDSGDWWDNSKGDRTKGEEGLRPFEEAGWWYRIVQKTQAKRCLHCHNTDGTYGQWRIEAEWQPKDWAKTQGNTRCKECLHQGLGHDEEQERPHCGGKHSKERGREFLHQTVLTCQPADTRLKDDDRDTLGTVTLTAKDLRRILAHGQHFPFLTTQEREEGDADHWETDGPTSLSLRRFYVSADRYWRKRLRRRNPMSTSGL